MKTFSKSSIPLMRADTQFAVVEATLKGYNKWISSHGKAPQQDVRDRFLYSVCLYSVDGKTGANAERTGDRSRGLGIQFNTAEL